MGFSGCIHPSIQHLLTELLLCARTWAWGMSEMSQMWPLLQGHSCGSLSCSRQSQDVSAPASESSIPKKSRYWKYTTFQKKFRVNGLCGFPEQKSLSKTGHHMRENEEQARPSENAFSREHDAMSLTLKESLLSV